MPPEASRNRPRWMLILTFGFLTIGAATWLRIQAQGASLKSQRQDLPAIRTDAGVAARSVLPLPGGPCVILHFPPTQPEDVIIGEAKVLSAEDIARLKDKVPLLSYSHWTTFNCVTFALADALEIGPYDWIEPIPRSATYFTNPGKVILDSYYAPIVEVSAHGLDWEKLERSQEIHEGDVICYRKQHASELLTIHMGRVHKSGGRNLVLSKLGIGPIVEHSIAYGAENYAGDQITIYRLRSPSDSPSS